MKILRTRRNMEIRRKRAEEVQAQRAKRTDLEQLELIEKRTRLGMGESKREKERLQHRIAVKATEPNVKLSPSTNDDTLHSLKAKERRSRERHKS